MARAGRPVKTLVTAVTREQDSCAMAARCSSIVRRLQAEQVRRPGLDAGSAKCHRARDVPRVRDPAGCNDRHAAALPPAAPARNVPAWLLEVLRGRNRPRWPPASQPCAMIASTPLCLEPAGFIDGGRRGEENPRSPAPAPVRAGRRLGKPEVKTDDRRLEGLDDGIRLGVVIERKAAGTRRHAGDPDRCPTPRSTVPVRARQVRVPPLVSDGASHD